MAKADARLRKWLKEHRHATLSTVSASNKPHAAAIYYVTDDDLNFYFVTDNTSRKYKHIKARPSVAMTITHVEQQLTAQLTGRASEVKQGAIIRRVLNDLETSTRQQIPVWPP